MKTRLLYNIVFFLFLTGCGVQKGFVSGKFETGKEGMRPLPLVILDPGHGGKDPGARSALPFSYAEKNLTLYLAKKAAFYLKEKGIPSKLTRENDSYISLEDRVNLASSVQGGVFVSIHGNAAKNKDAEGLEVFYFDDGGPRSLRSKVLAETLFHGLVKRTKAKPRSVKKSGLYVIKNTTMPAALIETGFLSNPKEAKRLQDPLYLDILSFGIAEAIASYLTQKEIG